MSAKDGLLYEKKNTYDLISEEEQARADEYCEEYKTFLDKAKTEREAVKEGIRLAEQQGFVPFVHGMNLAPGSKIYKSTSNGKVLMLVVIGQRPLSDGVNIAAAHIDSPRLDLKQVPLYEDSGMAFFKTHYYGGVKKYQWVANPLALHGVVIKKDGQAVDIVIGEDDSDPVIMVTDLLPHLGKDQDKKPLGEAFTGENMNILIGSRPTGETKDKDRVKRAVMQILNEKYGITEEDFMSAEIQAVPVMKARDMGLDRSMISGYGHDCRCCSFAALKALFDLKTPEMTAVCVLVDKEEVGSDGLSGMQCAMFEDFMADLCDTYGGGIRLRECLRESFCLSADVCNAYDPNFPEVSERMNAAMLGSGLGIMKYTGARGKGGASDASAEIVAMLRRIYAENGVAWQMASLGKVDQGGGGTVAKFMANRNIPTIDIGTPVLSMHAPYEIISKLDWYMTYRGILTVYERNKD